MSDEETVWILDNQLRAFRIKSEHIFCNNLLVEFNYEDNAEDTIVGVQTEIVIGDERVCEVRHGVTLNFIEKRLEVKIRRFVVRII